jgi:allantoicase
VPRTEAGGHAADGFPVARGRRFTHLRLRQYPDGGVARLRLYGSPTGEGLRRAAARRREPETGHLAG